MTAARISALLAVVIATGCAPAPEEAALYLSAERGSFDGRLERVVVRLHAFGVGGAVAQGSVRLSAPVGQFIGGDEVALADGFATATYACNPDEERTCNGTVRLSGVWGDVNASTQVRIIETVPVAPVEWDVVPTLSLDTLLAMAVASDGTAWAVGERGTVRRLVDRTWVVVPSPVREDLRAIALDADDQPVIVGDDGVVLRAVDGQLRALQLEAKADFTAVALDADGAVLVGSHDGVLWRLGEERLEPQLDLQTPVRAMARQGAEVWAAGDGVLARYSERAWFNLPMPVAAQFAFAQPGRDCLWLVGSRQGASAVQGVVVSGPGPTWRSAALPQAVFGFAEVPGADERFALASTQLYRQLGAADWAAVALPAPMNAMVSRAQGDLVLVGPPGISLLRRP